MINLFQFEGIKHGGTKCSSVDMLRKTSKTFAKYNSRTAYAGRNQVFPRISFGGRPNRFLKAVAKLAGLA